MAEAAAPAAGPTDEADVKGDDRDPEEWDDDADAEAEAEAEADPAEPMDSGGDSAALGPARDTPSAARTRRASAAPPADSEPVPAR